MTTPRSANRVTRTAAAGTASATSTASSGEGVRKLGNTLMPNSSIEPTSSRPSRKNPVPNTSPSAAPASASPAAIRRVMPPSEPTSRSAASRRSRRSPPNRTAAAMNTATGISSTTRMTRMSSSRIGGMPSSAWASATSPKRSIRPTLPSAPTRCARSSE